MRFLWGVLSSPISSAVLGAALAALVAVSVVVPQGWIAVELAGLDEASGLRQAYRWGLTDVAHSPWLYGLLVLLGVNLAAGIIRVLIAPSRSTASTSEARVEIAARRPERAAEALRLALGRWLGRPVEEAANGPRVRMVFETAPRARWVPLVLHCGLGLLLVGAVLAARPAERADSLVKAEFVVRDANSPSLGFFDVAQNEERQFFGSPNAHTIIGFDPDRRNLGPAVWVAMTDASGRLIDRFWVYRDAPPGFDARHRRGAVAITATRMGYGAKPGHGLVSTWASVVLLVGLGLLGIGLLDLGRPEGLVVVEADGATVWLDGVAARRSDAGFRRLFSRTERLARSALEV